MDQQMGYACAVGIVLTVVVLLLQKVCNMLLNEKGEEEKPARGTWFGILALFAFAQTYFYVQSDLLSRTATPGSLALWAGTLVAQLAVLVAIPYVCRRLAKGRGRTAPMAAGAALMLFGVFGAGHVPVLAALPRPVLFIVFGYALVLLAAPCALFKVAIGAAGGVLMAYGFRDASVNLIVTGLIFAVLATPWGRLAKRANKAYLAHCLKRPAPAVSKGDLYVAKAFARQQDPFYHAAATAGDWWLRFCKHLFIWFVLAFAFLPLYLMVIVSLKTNTQFYLAPTALTHPMHWENWASAWELVSPTVANSIYLSTLGTFFIVLFGLFGAISSRA